MDIQGLFSDNVLTTVLVFVITFLTVYFTTRRRQGIPPGPLLFPVIGNLLSLKGKDLFGQLEGLRKRYGDVYALYIGNELTIFLNGYDAIHDALVKKGSKFVNRPHSNFHEIVVKTPVIVFASGDVWKEQKLFAQKSLQELCFKRGGQNIEHVISTEGSNLIRKLAEFTESFDIDEYITVSVTNVISNVLFGHRFEFGDQELITIMKLISESARDVLRVQLLANCFPYLFKLPIDVTGFRSLDQRYYVNVMKSVEKYLEYNKDNPDTLLGMYRTKLDEVQSANSDTDTSFTDLHLHKLCYELIGTGSETTGATLRWILLYLIRDPDIQDKMIREIDREVGKDHEPCLGDKTKLPYVHAVTLEGLRIANVAPLAIPHSPSEDMIFRGYLFPKNCTVMVNLNSSLKDPDVWENPEEFRPERFLNEDRTEVVVPKEFLPFSLGPRSCLGETLARAELFLFTTMLVQNFEFLSEQDGCPPSIEGNLGLTWSPKSYTLRARPRK